MEPLTFFTASGFGSGFVLVLVPLWDLILVLVVDLDLFLVFGCGSGSDPGAVLFALRCPFLPSAELAMRFGEVGKWTFPSNLDVVLQQVLLWTLKVSRGASA